MEQAAHDDDLQQVVGSFRAGKRTLRAAVYLNSVLLLLGLGVPYIRGRLRATEARAGFGELAACLVGGEATGNGGLALPVGYDQHFAARYLSDDAGWPARCEPTLAAMAPPKAIFLWPGVKRASADLRATVELLQRELAAMVTARAALQDLPARPLLALEKVRAAQTLLARAAGNPEGLDLEATRLAQRAAVARPTRLPLHAAGPSRLSLWQDEAGLHVLSTDRRGVSLLRVGDGEVQRSRVRRSGLVRGARREAEGPFLVWATAQAHCEDLPDRCARRATGLAPMPQDTDQAPEPRWLAGHPFGPLQDSLRVDPAAGPLRPVWLLARRQGPGAPELRGFDLPEALAPDAPPLPPSSQRETGGDATVQLAKLLPGTPPGVFLVARGEPQATPSGRAPSRVAATGGADAPTDGAGSDAAVTGQALRPVIVAPSGHRHTLPALAGPHPWAHVCEADGVAWLVHGDASQLRAMKILAGEGAGDANPPSWSEATITLRTPAPGQPAGDAVKLACTARQVTIAHLDRELSLHVRRCTDARCGPDIDIARQVAAFDLAVMGDGSATVASSGGMQHRQVRVHGISPAGDLVALGAPAACIEGSGGLCGQPTLFRAGARLLLAARDRGDLLILQTREGQHGWEALDDLAATPSGHRNTTSPMRQHRVRKGL